MIWHECFERHDNDPGYPAPIVWWYTSPHSVCATLELPDDETVRLSVFAIGLDQLEPHHILIGSHQSLAT